MEWSLGFQRGKRHIKAMKRTDKRQTPKTITRDSSTVAPGGKVHCDQRRGLRGEQGWGAGCRGELRAGQVSVGTGLVLSSPGSGRGL